MRQDDRSAVIDLMEANGLLPSETMAALFDNFFSGRGRDGERWLCDVDNGLRALAMYAPEPLTDGTWNLLLIAVHPHVQSRGVGAGLVAAIESQLRGEARLLLVETSGLPEFSRTRAFYDRLGFGVAATIREYYRRGEDKVVFAKFLAAS